MSPKKAEAKKASTKTKPETKLRLIPLGGMREIGKNMTAFEYGDDLIVIDCGMAFPTPACRALMSSSRISPI